MKLVFNHYDSLIKKYILSGRRIKIGTGEDDKQVIYFIWPNVKFRRPGAVGGWKVTLYAQTGTIGNGDL